MEGISLIVAELSTLKKGDACKKVVAWVIRNKTSVKNEWVVRQLHMGRASNLARYVKEVDLAKDGELRELRKMM